MIDLATRHALLALYAAVAIRAVYVRRHSSNPARRRSLRLMTIGAVPAVVFWLEVLITSPVTAGALNLSVWLSRVAFAALAVVLLALQSFIRDAEHLEAVNGG